jgi:hypothetical protein
VVFSVRLRRPVRESVEAAGMGHGVCSRSRAMASAVGASTGREK